MEFEEGFEDADLDTARRFLAAFPTIDVDVAVARRAGRIRRRLRDSGQLMGDKDIFVAATALERNDALVTRDAAHLSRIEGLRVIAYA